MSDVRLPAFVLLLFVTVTLQAEDSISALRSSPPQDIIYADVGTFRYDRACELHDDGLSVICPLANSREHTQRVEGAGSKRLLHYGILFGSVKFKCQNSPDKLSRDHTDLDLHGHSWAVVENNSPRIDHSEGRTTLAFPNLRFDVTYRYATQPGRWLRVWSPTEPVSPYMLGATGKGDESNLLAWTFTLAHRLGRDVFIDREYFYSQVLEIQPSQRIYGRGSDEPGLSLLAADVFAGMRQDQKNVAPRWSHATPLHAALNTRPPVITHNPACRDLTVERLQLNGQQQQVNWRDVQTNATMYKLDEISDTLRNSACAGGIAFMKQNSRPVAGLKVKLNDVHVHDFPSSCFVIDPDVRLTTLDVRAGNTVSGRILYYFPGYHQNLYTYGFSRTSVARLVAPFVCDGWRYEGSGAVNPWPENTAPEVVMGAINEDHADVRHARVPKPFAIRGLDFDLTGSMFTTALSIGVECSISGVVRGGQIEAHPNAVGAINGAVIDVVTENSRLPNLSFPTGRAFANWGELRYRQTETRTNRPEPAGGWDYTGPAYNEWSKLIDPAPVIRVKRMPEHSAEFVQTIHFTIDSDWPCFGLLHIADLASLKPDECVPTRVFFEGGRLDNRIAKLISIDNSFTANTWPEDLEKYPVRIYCDGMRFNLIDPGAFRGDNFYPQQFKLLKLRNCQTPDGMQSEDGGMVRGKAGEQVIEIATNLMWRPEALHLTPMTADATKLFAGFEWTVVREGQPNEDARRPTLRIKLDRAITAAQDVAFQWEAQVSPW